MLKTGSNKRWTMRGIAMAGAVMLLALAWPACARTAAATQENLLDRIQIEDMMVEYYSILTQHVRHDIGDFYIKDAVLLINGAKFKGRKAIQKLYDSSTDTRILKDNIYNIILANPRITVDGDKATMDSIWTGYLSDNVWSTPRLVEQGTEKTELVKQDGVWLITRRVITNQGGMPLFTTGDASTRRTE